MPRRSSPRADGADAEYRIVRKTLADGTVKEYRYPRKPPTKASRYAADSLDALIVAYRRSPEFAEKAPATVTLYNIYLRYLEDAGHLKVTDLKRRQLLSTRDVIAKTSGNGAATVFGRVASTLFAWAVDRGWIEYNPLARLKSLKGGELPAWTDNQIDVALEKLDESYRRVVILGLYTGQRRSDLTAMTWSAYDGATIKLKQIKTGRELVVPVHATLKAELDAWKSERSSTHILTSPKGLPWEPGHLTREMKRRLEKLGFPPRVNIHGLRKVAATRLAEAGCSSHEIAAITGHATLSMVAHYTKSADQEKLARAAISRLETAPKKPRETGS